MYKLVIKDDEGNKTVVAFYRQELSVGRKEGNTIRLTEQNVSRHHARIFKSNDTVYVEDLGSYVGTFVNRKEISERTRIESGDEVLVGDYMVSLIRDNEEDDDTVLMKDDQGNRDSRIKPVPVESITGNNSKSREMGGDAGSNGAYPLDSPYHKLVFQNLNWAGSTFNLTQSVMTIGGNTNCDIVINHKSISSHHAKLTCDGPSVKIKDTGSELGISINGEPYQIAQLTEGDMVELGNVTFRFCHANSTYIYKKGGDNKGIFIGIAVAVIALIIGVIIAFSGGKNDKTDNTSKNTFPETNNTHPKSTDNKNTNNTNDNPSSNKMVEMNIDNFLRTANQFKDAQNWAQAERFYRKVLELKTDHKAANNQLSFVMRELEYEKLFTKSFQAFLKEDYAAALTGWNQIPKESAYYARVIIKKENMLAKVKTKVERLIGGGDFKNAEKLLLVGLQIKPNDQELQDDLEDVQKNPTKKVTRPKRRKNGNTHRPKVKRVSKRSEAIKLAKEAQMASFSNPRGALKIALTALKTDSRYAPTYRIIGFIYNSLQMKSKAKVYLKNYIKMAPRAKDVPRIREFMKSL